MLSTVPTATTGRGYNQTVIVHVPITVTFMRSTITVIAVVIATADNQGKYAI